jgi:hypothetical protein
MTDAEKVKVLRNAMEVIHQSATSTVKDIARKALDATFDFGEKPPADIPFDLARAQRGEKVQSKPDFKNHADVHFVGIDAIGKIVVQYDTGHFASYSPENLRMAPKKMLKLKIQVVQWKSGQLDVAMSNEVSELSYSATLIGDPIEIEVPDTRK